MEIIILLTLFSGCIYVIPWGVASYRKHPNINAIIILNLLLGWTFIGWVVALVWAFTNQKNENTK